MIKRLKNVLLNRICLMCGNKLYNDTLDHLCDDCLLLFDIKSNRNSCPICFHPLDGYNCPSCSKLDKIYYDSYNLLQYYTRDFKHVIMKLKKKDNFLVLHFISELLIQKGLINTDSYITVVPDHWFTKLRKGRSSLLYLLLLLKKKGYKTILPPYKRKLSLYSKQKLKNEQDRIRSINEIFVKGTYKSNCFKDKTITLIDDVYTTGATINYGAKLLKEIGFKKVHAITFFRAIIRTTNRADSDQEI